MTLGSFKDILIASEKEDLLNSCENWNRSNLFHMLAAACNLHTNANPITKIINQQFPVWHSTLIMLQPYNINNDTQ